MAKDGEWLMHMQEDIQRTINMERRLRRKRQRIRRPQPSCPSAKALYHAAIEDTPW